MFKVTIKDAQGAELSELRMAGEVITLEPAQVLTFETTCDKISSLVREGNSLHLYLGGLFDVEISNFFDLPDSNLRFSDTSLSADQLHAMMTLRFLVTHENRGEREIEALPGSRLQVQGGDQFEFYNTEVSNADLHRKINNLQVNFHLESDESNLNNFVNLVGFFDPRIGGAQPPIVILIDSMRHTTDMFVQPSRKEFEMMGAPTTIALAGVFYAFYFTLKNYDPDSAHVEVIFDGQPLPSWLSLNYLGDGRFGLSGVPPLDYEGTANVEINIHAKGKNVNIHTQQAYQLIISAKPELTERAAVGGVLEAEVRGAVATQSSESFMASSQAAASSTAPLAILAAVSSLTVFGKAYDTQLEQVKFTQYDVDSLLGDDFGLDFTTFVISAGESTISITTSQTDYLSGGDLDDDAREFREDRDDRDDRDRDDGADVIATGAGEIVTEITPTILYDDSSANTQGDFETNPANIEVPESVVFTGDAPGLLGGAFLNNEQTPIQEIFSLRGKAQDIGKEVELESGAIVTLNANGSYIYDPNDAWEYLAQGDIAEESFTYVVNNFFLQATGTVTFIIQGENDAPIIDDATNDAVFEIAENSPVFDIAPILLAADIDQNDVLSWKIVGGSETPLGSTAFSVNSVNGEITVADVLQLDFETTPTFTFVVEVADTLLATDDTTITINLIDVNENPQIIQDQIFIIDEIPEDVIEMGNVPNETVVGTVDAFDVDAGDSFTYAITDNPFNVFLIDEDTGEITLDNDVVNGGNNPIDFETNTTFTVEVTVTDEGGLTDVQNVTVNLNEINDAPILVDDQTFTINEIPEDVIEAGTVPAVTVIGNVLASDVDDGFTYAITDNPFDAFLIDENTGELTVNRATVIDGSNPIDFETNENLTVEITVTDARGKTDVTDVLVNFNEVNDAPILELNQSFTIDEIPQDQIARGNYDLAIDTVQASDVDDGFTYAITDNPFSAFLIDANTGALTLNESQITGGNNPIDFETNTSFTVEITVTDQRGKSDTENVTVNLSEVNDAPILVDDQSFTIDEIPEDIVEAGTVPATTVVGTVLASDVDDGFTYAITDNPLNAFEIDANTGEITVNRDTVNGGSNPIDYETNPIQTIEVTVTDARGKTDVTDVTINLSEVNDAPILVDDQSFTIDEIPEDIVEAGSVPAVTVVGTVLASDVDDGFTYAITDNPLNAFEIDANTGEITVNRDTVNGGSNPIDYETNPLQTIEVTVTDARGKTDVTDVTINLSEVNDAPIIVDDQSFTIDEIPEDIVEAGSVPAVTVVGTVLASDVDDEFTYAITDNPLNAFEIDANSGEITVNRDTVNGGSNPIDFEANPIQIIKVTVTDDRGKTDVTNVTVNLSEINDAPILVSNQIFTIDEIPQDVVEAGAVPAVTVVGTVIASDVDDGFTYAITRDPLNAFEIDANTGEITVNRDTVIGGNNPIDFETNPTQVIEVTVTDARGKTDVENVTINLDNVNDAPIIDQNQSFTIDEVAQDQAMAGGNYSTTVDTVQASDVDNNFTYALTVNPFSAFLIDPNTGEITLDASVVEGGNNPIDFESNPSFVLQVTTTDDEGKTDVENVTINVRDINDAPIMDLGQTYNVDENSVDGTVVGSVSASDVDAGDDLSYAFVDTNLTAFAIDSDTGEITVANQSELDHETTDQYTLQVEVTDLEGKSDIEDVVIDVNDVNEAPEINTTFSLNIDENSADGVSVGTVNGTDVDDADQGNLSYSITSESVAGAFEIDSATGEITVLDMNLLDTENTSSITLEVTITDLGLLTDTTNVTIDLNDVNEFDPVVDDQSFGLDENLPSGTVVGMVAASDADFADDATDLTYSITQGGGFDAFAINSATGELTIDDASEIDFEAHTNGEIVFEVTVEDVGGRSDTANVTVNLNDLNEAPIIPTGQTFNVDENATTGTVGTVTASDPDAGDSVVAYRFTSANTDFAIDNSGVITVLGTASLDAETQAQYTLEVEVEDQSGTMTTQDVVIDINDLNEATPVVNDQTLAPSIDENSDNGTVVGTVAASDSDLNDNSLTYSITEGGGFDAFTIDANTGEITVDDVNDIDHEAYTNGDVTFEVTVTDQGGLMDTADITVNLTDLNELPVAPSTLSLNVDENTNNNTVVGNIGATDEDDGHQANLSYSITDPNNFDAFDVENNGDITVNRRNQLDIESTLSFTFTVTTTDPGGLSVDTLVTIDLNDVNEFNPSIDDTSFPDLDENTINGTKVGTVDASDLDVNDIDNLSYSITSNPANAFAIDGDGVITVADETLLDFETNPTFTVQVVVTDQGGQSDTANLNVILNDLNETPVVDLNGSGTAGIDNSINFVTAPVAIAAGADNIFDPEAGITTVTITLTNMPDGTDEGLDPGTLGAGFSGSYDDNTGILEITGSGTNAEWETVLDGVTYFNNNPTDLAERTIEVSVSDGVNTSVVANTTVDLGGPLRAEEGENQSDVTAPSLSYEDLNAAVDTAYDQWVQAGLGEEQLAILANTDVSIADLNGDILGLAFDSSVVIDSNAANYGWGYGDNSVGGFDLVTVINHEFGHVLGIDEHTEEGLFAETLAVGESYDLESALLDFDELTHDDHDDHTSLDELAGDEIVNDDDLSFDELDTQTAYADDLLPKMSDSLQSDGNHVGTHAVNDYTSLTVEQQENVV